MANIGNTFGSNYTLYYTKGIASLAPKFLLQSMHLKDIHFEEVNIQSHTLVNSGTNYFEINKTGFVPALKLEDGTILTETSAILQYFAEMDPSSKFLPPLGISRYLVLEKVSFIATELHKVVDGWFKTGKDLNGVFAHKLKRMLSILNDSLGDNCFIANNSISIADFYLMTILFEVKYFAKINSLEGYKNLYRYFNEMKKNTNIIEVLKSEDLLDWAK